MRRFDRAMYALFLLALLADFARSQVPVSIGGDTAGGLILSAAQELQVGPGEVASLVLRRASATLPPFSKQESRWAIARWVLVLSGRLDHSGLALLAFPVGSGFDGPRKLLLASGHAVTSSQTVFDHTGSPAP